MRRKVKVVYYSGWHHHRYSWDKILYRLEESLGDVNGTLLIGAVEQYFNAGQRIDCEWIGFIHWCPDIPKYVDILYGQGPYDLSDFLLNQDFLSCMKTCKGIFVFSEHLKHWLQERLDVPVESVLYPADEAARKFSFDAYRSNTKPMIIMIGHWLRVFRSIFELPTATLEKVWLRGDTKLVWEKCIEVAGGFTPVGKTTVPDYVSNDEFDNLLSQNLGFLHLYKSSANNAVVDCLARHTPLLVNRIDSVAEYLGSSYPFYFISLEEAAYKAENLDFVYETYQYLKNNQIQEKISLDYFIKSVESSEIYGSL